MFYAALAGEIDLQDHEQSVRQAVVAQAELEFLLDLMSVLYACQS